MKMKLKKLFGTILSVAVLLTGCISQSDSTEGLTQEERELNAVRKWFEQDITDEDDFSDLVHYQYYARTIGLDKDGLLTPDMWEIYYSESININKDIDGQAIYAIRLNPDKLIEVWAANNEMTADELCGKIGTTRDDLYYNFGYTSNSIDYIKGHKENKVTYPDIEDKIFGEHNGENRQIVFGTHFLKVGTGGKNRVTYNSTDEDMDIRQRDLLNSITKSKSYNYSEYDVKELAGVFSVNDVKIRRLLLLDIPSGRTENEGESPIIMFNASPFSYGCTDDDRIELYAEEATKESTEESAADTEKTENISEEAPVELPDESEVE